MKKSVNEYGTASIGSPVLFKPTADFNFKLTATADNFYQDAKTKAQVSAAGLDQSVLQAGLGISAGFSPALVAPDAVPAPTTAPTADTATARFVQLQFTKPGELPTTSPSFSSRSAIITAAGDNATAAMFKALGNPDGLGLDRVALFAVSTVSVNPGWKTRKDYAADVSLTALVRFRHARPESVKRFVMESDAPLALKRKALLTLEPHSTTDLANGTSSVLKEIQKDPAGRQLLLFPDDPPAPAPPSKEEQPPTTIPIKRPGHAQSDDKSGPSTIRENIERNVEEVLDDNSTYLRPGSRSTVARDFVPEMTIISPLTDAQSLDLESSKRKRIEIALQIALFLGLKGAKAEANQFLKYAHDQELDVTSATVHNTVNMYSYPGGVAGFQVGPQLVALDTAGGGQPSLSAANTLERQSFPCLILITIDRRALTLKFEKSKDSPAFEPYLEINSESSWVPLTSGNQDGFTFEEKAKLSYNVNHAFNELDARPSVLGQAKENTKKRLDDFRLRPELEAFGSTATVEIPPGLMNAPDSKPAIAAVVPPAVQLTPGKTLSFTVALTGKNLSSLTQLTTKPLGKADGVTITGAALQGDSIVLSVNATQAALFAVELSSPTKGITLVSPPISVQSPDLRPGYYIERRTAPGIDRIEVSKHAPSRVVGKEIEKNKPTTRLGTDTKSHQK